MNNKKKNKIIASLTVIVACLVGFQNCVQEKNSRGDEKELDSSVTSSSSAQALGTEILRAEDLSSSKLSITKGGAEWKYSYDEAQDILSIQYQDYDLRNSRDNSSQFSAQITGVFTSVYEGSEISCRWTPIRGDRKTDGKMIEYIIMACAGEGQNRIYISANKRNLTDRTEFKNNNTNGILCFKAPCPLSSRDLAFDGESSTWTHFIMRESNGETTAFSSRLNMKLYPIFAKRDEVVLWNGVVTSTEQRGLLPNDQREFEVRVDYNMDQDSLSVSHQTFFFDTQMSSPVVSHGSLNLLGL